jgi:F0F1-type ATP synthase membrane subunit c/vacuolar-type H+-ATPase subunit K
LVRLLASVVAVVAVVALACVVVAVAVALLARATAGGWNRQPREHRQLLASALVRLLASLVAVACVVVAVALARVALVASLELATLPRFRAVREGAS